MAREDAVLRGVSLRKSYRAPSSATIRVLAGVDVAVGRGEVVVITGPSGSGKSTLLHVLGLLEDADGGEVFFGGERVSALGRSARSRARGRHIGFVFQSFLLLPSLTALDNVLLAARYVGSAGADARRRALALLEELGLGARRDHYPPELSGGEQQRVAVCRAILNAPPLLFADEPSGNLDDANGRAIMEILVGRARAGAGLLIATHRPDGVPAVTRVLRLRDGALGRDPGEGGTA